MHEVSVFLNERNVSSSLHFVRDGPGGQFRTKTWLMARNINVVTWPHVVQRTEEGIGKGTRAQPTAFLIELLRLIGGSWRVLLLIFQTFLFLLQAFLMHLIGLNLFSCKLSMLDLLSKLDHVKFDWHLILVKASAIASFQFVFSKRDCQAAAKHEENNDREGGENNKCELNRHALLLWVLLGVTLIACGLRFYSLRVNMNGI